MNPAAAPPRRATWAQTGVDLAALLGLLALACVTFARTYGGTWVWVTGLGGTVLGLAVGLLGARRRFRTGTVALLTVGVYLLFGSALAMPSASLGGVLPTGRSLTGLLFGVTTAWKSVLTIDPPLGETGPLLVVPLLTMLLAGVGSASVALRSSRPTWAWLPPAAAAALGIAFGLPSAWRPWVVAAGFVTVSLAWTAHRRGRQRSALLGGRRRTGGWRPIVLGAGVLALAVTLAAAAAPVVAPAAPRAVLREVVTPPLEVHEYPSPLQTFRANLADHRDDPILTLTGVPDGALVRVATLDAYDGITFNVASSAAPGDNDNRFRRIGSEVPEPGPGTPARVGVQLDTYASPFLPTVGNLRRVEFAGTDPGRDVALNDQFFYNRATGTAADATGLRSGDRYDLDVVVSAQPSLEQIKQAGAGSVNLPTTEPIPETVKDAAQRLSGDAVTLGEVAVNFQNALRRGYYSNGLTDQVPSPSGHSVYRIDKLFNDRQMIGDEEQYAVAMALLARTSGLPSRVVYGYVPERAGDVVVHGRDVSAWVEINLDGLGWVVFRPAPDKDRVPESDNVTREQKPRPQVDNPPPPPERPDAPPPDNTPPEDPQRNDDELPINWTLVLAVGLGVGIPLLLLGVPLALITGLKRRRRLARLAAVRTEDQISGGWDELLDRARDFGLTGLASATRSEGAQRLAEEFPRTRDGSVTPAGLAGRADASVFGTGEPTHAQADGYWLAVRELSGRMRQSRSRWQRFKAMISLRSLRNL